MVPKVVEDGLEEGQAGEAEQLREEEEPRERRLAPAVIRHELGREAHREVCGLDVLEDELQEQPPRPPVQQEVPVGEDLPKDLGEGPGVRTLAGVERQHVREAPERQRQDRHVQQQDAGPDEPVVAELKQGDQVPEANIPDEVAHDAHVGAELESGLTVSAWHVAEVEHDDALEVLDRVYALQALCNRVEAAPQLRRGASQHKEEHGDCDATKTPRQHHLGSPNAGADNHKGQ
mmetsp:Transcript_10361/g.32248  ORF Transcript_10361/g.32248 Transcript_10361/m.32248 type:complete len:233 (-) Transcript_10361:324-1022(-)